MVHLGPAFGHDLVQITIGNHIPHIEKHRVQNHAFRIIAALEVNCHVPIPARQFKRRRLSQLGEQAHISKSLRQNQAAQVRMKTCVFRV